MASYEKYKTKKKGELWLFKMDVGRDPVTGDRKTTTRRGFASQKDAKAAAKQLERELADGTYSPDRKTTFSDLAKNWLEEYVRTVKVSTYDLRVRTVKTINSHIGGLIAQDLTRKQYQGMLDELAQKYTRNTLSIVHSTALLIFKFGKREGIIKKDPSEYAILPRSLETLEDAESDELPKYMEKEELSHFLHTVQKYDKPQNYMIFLLLAYSGMRIGELIALKWTDVDFNENTIKIAKTCYQPNNNVRKSRLLPPKSKASKRKIDVDPDVVKELKKHRLNQNMIKNHPASPYVDQGHIFVSEKHLGYPYSKVTLESRMKKNLNRAGLSDELSPHSLRHTHVSLLAEAKVDLTEIMERLGHEDGDVTKRVYLHVTKTKRLEASNRFSQLMKDSAVKSRSK